MTNIKVNYVSATERSNVRFEENFDENTKSHVSDMKYSLDVCDSLINSLKLGGPMKTCDEDNKGVKRFSMRGASQRCLPSRVYIDMTSTFQKRKSMFPVYSLNKNISYNKYNQTKILTKKSKSCCTLSLSVPKVKKTELKASLACDSYVIADRNSSSENTEISKLRNSNLINTTDKDVTIINKTNKSEELKIRIKSESSKEQDLPLEKED